MHLDRDTFKDERGLADQIEEIAQHCASLPVLDDRTAEEILGYDGDGLPG